MTWSPQRARQPEVVGSSSDRGEWGKVSAVDPSIVDNVERVAGSVEGIRAVSSAKVRWLGHRLVADLAVTMDGDVKVRDAHLVADEIRHCLLHRVAHLDEVNVQVDPDGAEAFAVSRHHVPSPTAG